MKENDQKRPVATQTFSFHPYKDNYDGVMKICEASGRNPAEELRDLIDEALRAREFGQNGKQAGAQLTTIVSPDAEQLNRMVELLKTALERTSDQNETIKRLALHLREQYGLLLETLAGAYAARHFVWKFMVAPALVERGFAPDQIGEKLSEEYRHCNAERDKTADMIEQTIASLTTNQAGS